MILAVDVQYVAGKGVAAGVLFEIWNWSTSTDEFICVVDIDAEYVPGRTIMDEQLWTPINPYNNYGHP